MKQTLPEIFKAVQKAETKEAKLAILQREYSTSVAAVLSVLFNPNIKFNLPKGIPDGFQVNDAASMSLERAIRSFPSYVNVPNTDRLQMGWVRLTKALVKEEAEFAYAIKDRELDIGLSQADVHGAFPTLIPAPGTEKPVEKAPEPVAPEPVVVIAPAPVEVAEPATPEPDDFPDADEMFGEALPVEGKEPTNVVKKTPTKRVKK